jgi:hypothetical protein
MKLLISSFLLAAAVASAGSIPIEQATITSAGKLIDPSVTIDGDTINNVFISPYTLSLNGQKYAALCIDFFDWSQLNQPWSAYVTPLAGSNLSDTYHPTWTQEYEEDAYIYDQIIKSSGATRTGWQIAAWDIMAYGITNSSYKYLIGDNSDIDAALTNYNKINLAGFEIVSDVDSSSCNRNQEFLICTPEPGNLALLGFGLLATAAGVFRRRRSFIKARTTAIDRPVRFAVGA